MKGISNAGDYFKVSHRAIFDLKPEQIDEF
jgi:hypothetical protein